MSLLKSYLKNKNFLAIYEKNIQILFNNIYLSLNTTRVANIFSLKTVLSAFGLCLSSCCVMETLILLTQYHISLNYGLCKCRRKSFRFSLSIMRLILFFEFFIRIALRFANTVTQETKGWLTWKRGLDVHRKG